MLDDKLVFEEANLIFRNFSGQPSQYNLDGKRGFSIIIPTKERADELKELGWNVRPLRVRDEAEEPKYQLPVTVSFSNHPPTITLICGKNRTLLKEDELAILDWAELEDVGIVINPYDWEVNGKSGKKAYLRSLYARIEPDPLADKYAEKTEEELQNGQLS